MTLRLSSGRYGDLFCTSSSKGLRLARLSSLSDLGIPSEAHSLMSLVELPTRMASRNWCGMPIERLVVLRRGNEEGSRSLRSLSLAALGRIVLPEGET